MLRWLAIGIIITGTLYAPAELTRVIIVHNLHWKTVIEMALFWIAYLWAMYVIIRTVRV